MNFTTFVLRWVKNHVSINIIVKSAVLQLISRRLLVSKYINNQDPGWFIYGPSIG